MLADNITKMIGEAMKAHDAVRLSTLKMLSSALNYEFIAKQHKLSEEEEIVVVKHEAKKRKDAIEVYEKAGAQDRADSEKKELEILKEFMPEEMGSEELSKIVDEVIAEIGASQLSDMGRVIGAVVAKADGRADGAVVAGLVKSKLAA